MNSLFEILNQPSETPPLQNKDGISSKLSRVSNVFELFTKDDIPHSDVVLDFNAEEEASHFKSLLDMQEELEDDRRGFMTAPKKRGKPSKK